MIQEIAFKNQRRVFDRLRSPISLRDLLPKFVSLLKISFCSRCVSRRVAPLHRKAPVLCGIRREPELPEHEEIVPLESNTVLKPEAFLVEDADDDEAIKARVLRTQSRTLARQAAMDPDDGIAL